MCEYCEGVEKEDGEIITSLNTTNISMGIFGDGLLELEMEIGENSGRIMAWFSYDEGNENISAVHDINYCPMCGRKLTETED